MDVPKHPIPVHHDTFTENYYLQVIALYLKYKGQDGFHQIICEMADILMQGKSPFREDGEYCFSVCMGVTPELPEPF